MKIFYISNEEDERSRPIDNQLVFGCHVLCLTVDGTSVAYDYLHYVPERYFCGWREYQNKWVGTFDVVHCITSSDEAGVSFLDIDGESSEFFGVVNYTTSGGVVYADRFILEDYSEEKSDLNIYENLNAGFEKIIPGVGFSSSVATGQGLVICEWSSRCEAALIDVNFNLVWKREFPIKYKGVQNPKVYEHNNAVIFCLGRLLGADINSQIIALDSASGETVWQVNFPFCVNYYILIGDRVYVSAEKDWVWCVLDAATGEILLEQKLHFPLESNELGLLWADSGYLFLYYRYNVLRVMDEISGEIIQDINLPSDFSLANNYYPVVKNGHIYFRLGSAGGFEKHGAYGGVMVLPRSELQQGLPLNIELEEKGAISHRALVDGKTEYYEIIASYEELGDVLRFGQIEIKLVAQCFAYNFFGNLDDNWRTRINKKFAGRIVFCIDKQKLKNPDESKFDLMVEMFNKHFQKKFRAPANKKPLTLEWVYI